MYYVTYKMNRRAGTAWTSEMNTHSTGGQPYEKMVWPFGVFGGRHFIGAAALVGAVPAPADEADMERGGLGAAWRVGGLGMRSVPVPETARCHREQPLRLAHQMQSHHSFHWRWLLRATIAHTT